MTHTCLHAIESQKLFSTSDKGLPFVLSFAVVGNQNGVVRSNPGFIRQGFRLGEI